LVGREDTGMGQGIEQSRLAGIGVADQRNVERVATPARFALHTTLARKPRQALLEQLDPIAEQAAVSFKLLFAGSAHADTAPLALQVSPAPHQASREMFKLGQFNLQFALGTGSTQREDIENQAGAVDDATFEFAFEIA